MHTFWWYFERWYTSCFWDRVSHWHGICAGGPATLGICCLPACLPVQHGDCRYVLLWPVFMWVLAFEFGSSCLYGKCFPNKLPSPDQFFCVVHKEKSIVLVCIKTWEYQLVIRTIMLTTYKLLFLFHSPTGLSLVCLLDMISSSKEGNTLCDTPACILIKRKKVAIILLLLWSVSSHKTGERSEFKIFLWWLFFRNGCCQFPSCTQSRAKHPLQY